MSTAPCCEAVQDPARMKDRLFCPDSSCSHQSPASGDWVLVIHEFDDESWLAYLCPECQTEITRRPSLRQQN